LLLGIGEFDLKLMNVVLQVIELGSDSLYVLVFTGKIEG